MTTEEKVDKALSLLATLQTSIDELRDLIDRLTGGLETRSGGEPKPKPPETMEEALEQTDEALRKFHSLPPKTKVR